MRQGVKKSKYFKPVRKHSNNILNLLYYALHKLYHGLSTICELSTVIDS